MNDREKYLSLLKKQLDKLDSAVFDLAAWKRSTVMILSSIFGTSDARTKTIESIEYEYNSWSLRDETGSKDPIKDIFRETLQTIINEIELSDTFATYSENSSDVGFIWEAFENELTGAKSKALKRVLTEEKNNDIRNTEIDIILQELPDDTKRNILKHILLSEKLKLWLSK
jgi:RNA recognition motif-containing protein